jgi:hypothetical protein
MLPRGIDWSHFIHLPKSILSNFVSAILRLFSSDFISKCSLTVLLFRASILDMRTMAFSEAVGFVSSC